MFGLGSQEIIVVLVVALLLFGPAQLPEIGKQVGKAMREFQNMSGEVQRALTTDDSSYSGYNNRTYSAQPYREIPAPNHTAFHEPETGDATLQSEPAPASLPATMDFAEQESKHTSAVAVAPTHTEDKEEKAA